MITFFNNINKIKTNKRCYILIYNIIIFILILTPHLNTFCQTFRDGYNKYIRGDFKNAEIIFIKALKKTNNNKEKAKIYKYIGITQYMQHKNKLAISNFKTAISLNPTIFIHPDEVLDERILHLFNSVKKKHQAHQNTKPPHHPSPSNKKIAKIPKATLLKVNSNVNGSILIDGILAGQTNSLIDVNPGKLEFVIQAPGYISKKIITNITPNTENTITINLVKIPPQKPPKKQTAKTQTSQVQLTTTNQQQYKSPSTTQNPNQPIYLPIPKGKKVFGNQQTSNTSSTIGGRDLTAEFETDSNFTQQPTNPYYYPNTSPQQATPSAPPPPPPPTYYPYYAPYTPTQPYYIPPGSYPYGYGMPYSSPYSYNPSYPPAPPTYQYNTPQQSVSPTPPSIDEDQSPHYSSNSSNTTPTKTTSVSQSYQKTQDKPYIDYYFDDTPTTKTSINKKNSTYSQPPKYKPVLPKRSKIKAQKQTSKSNKIIPKITATKTRKSSSKIAAILVSLLPFGAGQYYHGKFLLGLFFTTTQISCIGYAYYINEEIKKAIQTYKEQPDDEELQNQAQEYVNKATQHKNITLIGFFSLWGLSTVESLIFGSKPIFGYIENKNDNLLYAFQNNHNNSNNKIIYHNIIYNNAEPKSKSDLIKFGLLFNINNNNNINIIPALNLNLQF